jgi:hypothetical protein
MDSRQRLLILIGAIACIGFAFIDIYISAFVAVIVGILYMMIWIMQDSAYLPHVVCSLSEDAKSILVENVGTAPAVKIHVALVPLDVEYDIKELMPDAQEIFSLEKMVREGKAVVRYTSSGSDQVITHSYPLSGYGGEAFDPLKPVFPLFGYQK